MLDMDKAESLGKRARALYRVVVKLNSISGYHLGVEKAILNQAIAQLFEECPQGCEATFTGVFMDGDFAYMASAGHYLTELLQASQGPRVDTVSTGQTKNPDIEVARRQANEFRSTWESRRNIMRSAMVDNNMATVKQHVTVLDNRAKEIYQSVKQTSLGWFECFFLENLGGQIRAYALDYLKMIATQTQAKD